ncbi:MAG: helix-turn-helix transcriptional regulator [Clostridia bacterium]|nr:helix-turn-helix transcriptional regulator [Clostridia bacterium]
MDLIKVGRFLQSLRREKGLTQQQLAEITGTSQRTVSRWETGNNMPDIDTLIGLSDLYGVDLREILSGQRKDGAGTPDESLKETALQTADYDGAKEKKLIGRILIIVFAGFLAYATSLVTALKIMNSVTGGIAVLILSSVCFLLYALVTLSISKNRTNTGYLNCLTGAFAAAVAGNLLLLAVFFKNGSYHNYGMAGTYLAVLICAAPFILAGITVTLINCRKRKSG